MKIPNGYTEQEVVDIIQRVSGHLAHKFRFGYHSIEDIQQQAAVFAIQGLEYYDGVRPLENFLWVHVRNRLYNFKRNNYSRPDSPCAKCSHNIESRCNLYGDSYSSLCSLYSKWDFRNKTKRNLMSPHSYDEYMESDKSISNTVEQQEIFDIIDRNIPVNMREDWLRFINQIKLSTNKKNNLLDVIYQILEDHNIES